MTARERATEVEYEGAECIMKAIEAAILEEREACAMVADYEMQTEGARDDRYCNACEAISVAIRARG